MHTNTLDNKSIHRNYSKLLISESPLQVLPTLAVKIGLNEALMLQQVHYWISNPMNKNMREGRTWVYKTYAEWQKEFPFWSLPTIKRTSLSLEKIGVLIATTGFNRLITDRTKWYSIDYEKLDSLEIGTLDQIDSMVGSNRSHGRINLIPSIPETTTEITTENNNKPCKVIKLPQLEPKPKPIQQPQLEPDGSVVVDLINTVRGWAVSRVLMESWLKKHGLEYLQQKIELTKSANAKNPGAYLNKAISLDWMLPAPKEDEEVSNKPSGPIFPTHEENITWYQSLTQEEKQRSFEYALTKNAHYDKILDANGINFLSEDFIGGTWFKMLMSLIGRAR